jgi:hypothetical protein
MQPKDKIFAVRNASDPRIVIAVVTCVEDALLLAKKYVHDMDRATFWDSPATPGMPYRRIGVYGLHRTNGGNTSAVLFYLTEEEYCTPFSVYSGNGMGFVSQLIPSAHTV